MGKMKGVFIILKEFLGSRKLHFGKPRVFFGGIALPLDKVLSTGRSSFVMNDLFDFVMFLVVDKVRGWGGEVPSMNFIFVIRR